jgi:mannose-6-phosphate isomerase-like protein (cupin superfamily)
LQYHEKKVETVYVNHGTLKLHLRDEKDSEDKIKYLSKGESFHIPANTIHRFSSTEDGEVELVEVSTPELDDVIRIQDDYGRK